MRVSTWESGTTGGGEAPGVVGQGGSSDAAALRARCRDALHRARDRTRLLTDAPESDLTAQHTALMSPLVWDLAHIGNQEDRWLVRAAGGQEATPAYRGRDDVRRAAEVDELYDAFRHPRSTRPGLPLLDSGQARDYVDRIRRSAFDVLEHCSFDDDRLTRSGFVFGMVAQHEQQHDETMLATHQLRDGPALLTAARAPRAVDPDVPAELAGRAIVVPAGPFTMGTDDDPWALDNERPAHVVEVAEFAIESAPVTNRRYARFIADGGYERPELWSERGWEHRLGAGLEAPQHWSRDATGRWWRRRFGAEELVVPDEPVVHVCYFEAEAFAAWAGKRLPTEAEWEKAARHDPDTGRSRTYPWGEQEPTADHANLGQRHLSPAEVGAYPSGATPSGVHQMLGDVWEWTSSGFDAYPGFEAFPYKEYSEVFFGGDFRVLRGGSFGTDAVACRGTFRNWDHPIRRQIFSGFRLAHGTGPAADSKAGAAEDAAGSWRRG